MMPRGLSIVTLRGKSQCLYLRVIATTQMMVFPAIIMLLATTEAIVIERARGKFWRVIFEASGLKKCIKNVLWRGAEGGDSEWVWDWVVLLVYE